MVDGVSTAGNETGARCRTRSKWCYLHQNRTVIDKSKQECTLQREGTIGSVRKVNGGKARRRGRAKGRKGGEHFKGVCGEVIADRFGKLGAQQWR